MALPPLTGFASRACAMFACQHQGLCGRGPESIALMVVLACSWHDACAAAQDAAS